MKASLALLTGLLFASSVLGQQKPVAIDNAAIESYVRRLFVWGPEVKVELLEPKTSKVPGLFSLQIRASAGDASQVENFLVSADGKTLIRGTVFEMGKDPFADEAAKLRIKDEPIRGPLDAPVTVVMFSDYQCSFCREEAKILSENLLKTYPKSVRLVYRDFPLEQIHPWARAASIAGRCVLRQGRDAFWAYHDWVFDQQPQITPDNFKSKFLEFARSQFWNVDKLGACLDSRATEAEVDRSIADAQALGINSTPTLFVNGRRMVGRIEWDRLKQVLDSEIRFHEFQKQPQAKPASNGGV
ncbi:MAG TPA: thioredoxin domain-containing protein [Bryobacteraceae bacterium]|nr:thioredoxin domain-containing protein [Bryobacteraceae bacterium]